MVSSLPFFFFLFFWETSCAVFPNPSLLRKGRTGCISRMTRQGRRSLGASHPLKIADSVFVMDSKPLAAIYDPGRSSQAAALDASFWKYILVLP